MMTRSNLRLAVASLAAVSALVLAGGATASVPATLTHQGRLYDVAQGDAPVNGTLTLVFRVYDADQAGDTLWSETHAVTFDDGYFSVDLGDKSPFGGVLDGSARWLGVTVGDDAELSPRTLVGSVPYSFLANDVNGDIHPKTVSIGGKQVIDASGAWVGSPSGVQGPAGPQGPEGPQGQQGAMGPAGPMGLQGPQGPQGPQGDPGPPGLNGMIGMQGPQGAQGAQGATGPSGITQCTWVTGQPCILGKNQGEYCSAMSACPAGTLIVSGSCEGFSSVAIGRSMANTQLQNWACTFARITTINGPNNLSVHAYCCNP